MHFFFLWISTVRLALARVRARVLEGGHDVPEVVVRRRFDRSIRNFLLHYRPLGDSWMFFDNSGATPTIVALEKQGSLPIIHRELYDRSRPAIGTARRDGAQSCYREGDCGTRPPGPANLYRA